MSATSLTGLTTEIVSSYVEKNKVAAADVPALIQTVYTSLANVNLPVVEPAPEPIKLTAGQIRKSITPAGLVSFEDGKTYQTLKRHLTTRGMTLADYKAKWGLPKDYPTTAPAYAARRSELAKNAGLGQKRTAKAKPAAKTAAKAKK